MNRVEALEAEGWRFETHWNNKAEFARKGEVFITAPGLADCCEAVEAYLFRQLRKREDYIPLTEEETVKEK